MTNFLDRIARGDILVADGAMGTQLMERGVDVTRCPEQINLTHPEILEDIARRYFEAGAEIVQANTFGASPLKLARYGLEDRTEEIIGNAVAAVRRAVGAKAYIYGSCGPCTRILKPFGDADPDDVYGSFVRQMRSFVEFGVDIIGIETMTDITEAVLAVRAARSVSDSIPVMAAMTFDPTPRGFFTIMGVDIRTAVKKLTEAGADLVGSNCGNGIERMVEIAGEFKNYTDRPLVIQSNAGLPQIKDGRAVYPESPEFMADKAIRLVEIGVAVIGGCCGTTPEHIAALCRMVDSHHRVQ
nr:homocysteine S-methyltransferase family protein [candidate division Zixibacteria bacterium]